MTVVYLIRLEDDGAKKSGGIILISQHWYYVPGFPHFAVDTPV
jgi:hypothetical protein